MKLTSMINFVKKQGNIGMKKKWGLNFEKK